MFTKKTTLLIVIPLLLSFFLPIFLGYQLSLKSFINILFSISSMYLFLTLLTFTVKSGFYDAVTFSFRRFFIANGKNLSNKEADHIIPLSNLITFDQTPFLFSGLTLFVIMLVSLFIYYA